MECRHSGGRRVRLALSFAAIALVGDASLARASDPSPTIAADVPDQRIYGGAPAGTCEWPSAVFLGGCTGTLVHPEVVIYAAHCGTSVQWAWFGEDSNQQQGRYVDTEFCATIPGGSPGYGNDFAVCKLAEPVTDVPIVPPLMGCETDVLQPGVEVWLVGFGETESGAYGTKYEVAVQLQTIENDEALLGGGGTAPCYGDSGGPAYVRLPATIDPEESWRVFGITSWGGECGTGGYYSMMHNGMDWFESET
ncbi:MAG TPA: trypsin-like serine protease, partial [Nannocystaceae bacterium]|nr:trypsin-like serine protease [Nannocystaceae bacterium]